MAYMIVIISSTDKKVPKMYIETDEERVDIVTVGQIVKGRRFYGRRIDTVVNLTQYDFENHTDPYVSKWWNMVKHNLTSDCLILNRYSGGSYET